MLYVLLTACLQSPLKQEEDEKITGDYQLLAYGLRIRFGGESDSDQAAINDEWEIEVSGANEETHASGAKSVKMSRWKR